MKTTAIEKEPSLYSLEQAIEPQIVYAHIVQITEGLSKIFPARIGAVLDIIASNEALKVNILINSLKGKETEQNKSHIKESIENINDLYHLVSGKEHHLIEERKEDRELWGYDKDKRSDGTNLATWMSQKSREIIAELRATRYKDPSPTASNPLLQGSNEEVKNVR